MAYLIPKNLTVHPNNRGFRREGAEWEGFVSSISQQGVLVPLLVRPFGTGYQIIFGHRRAAAALAAGIKRVPCLVRKIPDMDALEMLLVENMERETPDPVEEAMLIRKLVEAGANEELLALRIARSCDWVRKRQMLLDLGEEVVTALKLPRDDERHLGVGAAEVLLEVPEKHRPEAIQLVLHPDWKLSTLSAREAAVAVDTVILRPLQEEKAWNAGAKKLVAAWRKKLGEYLTKEERGDLSVQAVKWGERLPVCRPAEDPLSIGMEVTMEGEGKRWVHLALKHGLPVWVQPSKHAGEEPEAVVASGLLLEGERSCAEAGFPHWVAAPKKKGSAGDAERVRRATAACDGEPEHPEMCDDGPPPETVIEQKMESHAVVRLTPVRELLASATRGKVGAEDWWPAWAKRFEDANDREGLVEVLNWFLDLKGGS